MVAGLCNRDFPAVEVPGVGDGWVVCISGSHSYGLLVFPQSRSRLGTYFKELGIPSLTFLG